MRKKNKKRSSLLSFDWDSCTTRARKTYRRKMRAFSVRLDRAFFSGSGCKLGRLWSIGWVDDDD